MLRRLKQWILDSILSDLPPLETYHVPEIRGRKMMDESKSRLGKNQSVHGAQVWTWENPKEEGTGAATFEGFASEKIVDTKFRRDLDQYDLTILGERFGVDSFGKVKCDERQAVMIKKMRFIEGMSIDDIVAAKTANGKTEFGWSRSNIAKYSGCFTDAALLREEAQAKEQSKTV